MKSLRDIQRAQAPLVHRLGCGDTSVLHALFTERVAEWPHRLQHDELVTVGLFDDIGSLAPDTAFRTIPSAVELAAKSIETSHFECALVLLLTLARASDHGVAHRIARRMGGPCLAFHSNDQRASDPL